MPEASKEQMDSFNELQRRSATREGAARYSENWSEIDIRDLLPKVDAKTRKFRSPADRISQRVFPALGSLLSKGRTTFCLRESQHRNAFSKR
jgi:hypothetical protein